MHCIEWMEQSGKGSLKGSKDGWIMDRRTLCPKLQERKGAKGREAQLSVTWVKTPTLPCHNWSRGNGFCKYADACRYSHDGPKGGSNQSTTMAVTTKKIKKEKKNKPSLVITEYESDEQQPQQNRILEERIG